MSLINDVYSFSISTTNGLGIISFKVDCWSSVYRGNRRSFYTHGSSIFERKFHRNELFIYLFVHLLNNSNLKKF